MSEPVQTTTALLISGVSVNGALSCSTKTKRSDGWTDVESTTTFGSGPSTLGGLAWLPPIAAAASVAANSLQVAYFDASAGNWWQGTNNEGTTSIGLFSHFLSGTQIGIQSVTTAAPVPVGRSADRIIVTGRYRMASRYS